MLYTSHTRKDTDRPTRPFGGPLDREIEEAALRACGELGYTRLTVEHLLERGPVGRSVFYRRFEGIADCFARAHGAAVERLAERVLRRAARWPEWRSGLRAGLIELLLLVESEPQIARALVIEVHAAGGEALARHNAAKRRFARAIDAERARVCLHSPAPSPGTAALIVGGIETLVRRHLEWGEPEDVWELLPQLLHFAVLPYLGPEAAQAELARSVRGKDGVATPVAALPDSAAATPSPA
jgi:AcrR family transcriptional regulator